jgi:hypothetical protein
MHKYFKNYTPLNWIRFTPGSQYIFERERVRGYSRDFWKTLNEELTTNNQTEAHIIERIFWHLLNHTYEARF